MKSPKQTSRKFRADTEKGWLTVQEVHDYLEEMGWMDSPTAIVARILHKPESWVEQYEEEE